VGLAVAQKSGILGAGNNPIPHMDTPVSALLERKGPAVHAVSPSITIAEAVAEMNRNRIGCIVVLEAGKLVGIFTERDVMRRVVGAGIDPRSMRVADVMTRNVHTVPPEATIEQTMALFGEMHCRHIPVVVQGQVKGLISIGDISRWMSDASRAEADHLKNYIAGGFPA
jgi:CBS domain-containing protein